MAKAFGDAHLEIVNSENDGYMIIGLTEAATMGDARAAKVIIDLIGEEDSQGEAGVEIIDDL